MLNIDIPNLINPKVIKDGVEVDKQPEDWIDQLNLLNVAIQFMNAPEIIKIFTNTHARIYGAFKQIDAIECSPRPGKYAQTYLDWMKGFLQSQQERVKEHVQSVIAVNLPEHTLTEYPAGGGDPITTLKDMRDAVTRVFGPDQVAFPIDSWITVPAEVPQRQFVTILKRDGAPACTRPAAGNSAAGSTTGPAPPPTDTAVTVATDAAPPPQDTATISTTDPAPPPVDTTASTTSGPPSPPPTPSITAAPICIPFQDPHAGTEYCVCQDNKHYSFSTGSGVQNPCPYTTNPPDSLLINDGSAAPPPPPHITTTQTQTRLDGAVVACTAWAKMTIGIDASTCIDASTISPATTSDVREIVASLTSASRRPLFTEAPPNSDSGDFFAPLCELTLRLFC